MPSPKRTHPLHQVFLSIGSNMGSRIRALEHAVEALQFLSVGNRVDCSAVYETKPVGYLNQGDFLNMVACIYTEKDPQTLLSNILTIETEYGRLRDIRYGPRTLDLDILLYDDEYVCFNHLQIPHPRMWERAFVLIPLANLAPYRKGLGGETILAMANALAKEGDVRYVGRFW